MRFARAGEAGTLRRAQLVGLSGQGLTFAALLAPAVLAHRSALVDLVIVSSFANAVVLAAVLAAPAFYPGVADDRTAPAVLRASIALLAVSSIVAAVTAVLTPGLDVHTRGLVLGTAALTLCQGGDLLAVSMFVRADSARAIMHNRLRYGLASIVLTLGACAASRYEWSLVVSACLAYLVTLAWVVVTHRGLLAEQLRPARQARVRDAQPVARSAVVAALSYLVYGFGLQASAIALADAGRLTAGWSVVMRVAGGFGTVGVQLMAPDFDAAFTRMHRSGDAVGARRRTAEALKQGAALAVVGVGVALLLALATGAMRELTAGEVLVLVAAAVVFWFPTLATVVVFKALTLTGRSSTRFLWDGARFLALLAAVTLLGGQARLLAVSIVVGVFAVLLVPLVLARGRRVPADTAAATAR